jgi:transposase
MMLRETSMQIKFLSDEGMPKTRIAERLGVSRQTVYNHLNRKKGEPFPKARPARPSLLDPFRDYIEARLERFDLPATVVFQEIRKQGYRGGLTILRDFVRPLKQEFVRRVTERFETLPGQQAQIDWGECGTIEVGGERKTLYVFVMVLGYSRMMYARFTTSTKLPVLLACLARAFDALGMPKEILVDNMKQAVDQHDVTTGTVRWNKGFLDFAEHHGFLPVASPPYWPRVKGKVERGVGYLKTSFLEGRSFTDLEDLNRQLEVWLDTVANVRVHGTTGQRPVDRHALELPHLRELAAVPGYDTRPVEVRVVASDSHISYAGVQYSVDPVAVGRSVIVRPEGEAVGDLFSAYLGDRLVAQHRRRPKGAHRVTLDEHGEAIRRLTRGNAEAAARRRSRQPSYLQVVEEEAPILLDRIQRAAPQVQVRPLSAYERLLLEGVA